MKMRLEIFVCLGLSAGCGAARSSAPAESTTNDPASTMNDAASIANTATSPSADRAFVEAATRAGAVFEAVVVAVEPAPMVWSGLLAVYQTVTYRIVKIITDNDKRLSVDTQLLVRHLIVLQSKTADTKPQLRPDLVKIGVTVIVLADWRDNQWTGVDEHFGIVPADSAHRAALAVR